jgi:hypothetical protein
MTPGQVGVDANAQIAISAKINQTVLIRALDSAYVKVRYKLNGLSGTFIAADGRAYGVPPFAQYSFPFDLPAGIFSELTTARRRDLLIRTPSTPGNFSATVEWRHFKDDSLLFTGTIPITVTA